MTDTIEIPNVEDRYGYTGWTRADLNVPVFEAWLDRLENEGLPQTKGKLRRSVADPYDQDNVPGFCCLGVLCDSAETAGLIVSEINEDRGIYVYGEDEDVSLTPLAVERWAGLPNNDPVVWATVVFPVDEDDTETSIEDRTETGWFNVAALNDAYGFTFPQIAKALRDTYLS